MPCERCRADGSDVLTVGDKNAIHARADSGIQPRGPIALHDGPGALPEGGVALVSGIPRHLGSRTDWRVSRARASQHTHKKGVRDGRSQYTAHSAAQCVKYIVAHLARLLQFSGPRFPTIWRDEERRRGVRRIEGEESKRRRRVRAGERVTEEGKGLEQEKEFSKGGKD